jgi:hypothetical protein
VTMVNELVEIECSAFPACESSRLQRSRTAGTAAGGGSQIPEVTA